MTIRFVRLRQVQFPGRQLEKVFLFGPKWIGLIERSRGESSPVLRDKLYRKLENMLMDAGTSCPCSTKSTIVFATLVSRAWCCAPVRAVCQLFRAWKSRRGSAGGDHTRARRNPAYPQHRDIPTWIHL